MLSGKTSKLKSFRGDGAYDDFKFREQLGSEIEQIIRPPKDAVIRKGTKKKPLPGYLRVRNEAMSFIKENGSKAWKEKTGYPQRILNEVAMFRYKTIFGAEVSARKTKNQKTEVNLKCVVLNKYRKIGMPISCKAA